MTLLVEVAGCGTADQTANPLAPGTCTVVVNR